jgi:hypothetical protein
MDSYAPARMPQLCCAASSLTVFNPLASCLPVASCSKYKFMESHLVQQQKGLLVKIPDISNALQALHHLMRKEEAVSCHFELADSVFANATIKKENTVLLWLGANVMLEYNYEEADGLLQKNLKVHRHPHTTRSAVAAAGRWV